MNRLLSQCAGGHVGRHHRGPEGPPQPPGARLEPDLWCRGGGDAAAAPGGRSGIYKKSGYGDGKKI